MRDGESQTEWRDRLDREEREQARKVNELIVEIEHQLRLAGIRTIHISYSGGGDEGGGELSDEKAEAIVQQVVGNDLDNGWEATWRFVDRFVDQLGYGSWAGEFHASGSFDADLVTRRIVPGTHHGTRTVEEEWDF